MQRRTGFTDTYLRSLRPQERRYDVTEPGRRGLQIRVFPSGEKSFQFRYQLRGVTRRLTLGSYPATSLVEAHEGHTDAQRLLRQGKDPGVHWQSIRDLELTAGTVGALAQEFLARHVDRKRKRPEQARQILKANVLPYWADRAAKDITPRDYTLLLDRIIDRGSPTMANRTASLISQMFRFGMQRGSLTANPCVALQKPGGKEKSRERFLTEDEIRIFWTRLDTAAMADSLKLACRLLLVTGQRRCEIVNARWSDITFQNCVWRIPKEIAKNGREHLVPLSALAISLFQELHALSRGSDYLLPSRIHDNSPIPERTLSRAVRNNQLHFGLPHFTPHDFRRTAGSLMTKIGVPRLIVGKLLNHSERDITATYDRYDYSLEKQSALAKWSNYLLDMFQGPRSTIVPVERHVFRERRRA
ncbi:MAG: tyrosine-type recombinase/integrase [Steroidobacteraceae bacterium]